MNDEFQKKKSKMKDNNDMKDVNDDENLKNTS
jgi:hypothetical protein